MEVNMGDFEKAMTGDTSLFNGKIKESPSNIFNGQIKKSGPVFRVKEEKVFG